MSLYHCQCQLDHHTVLQSKNCTIRMDPTYMHFYAGADWSGNKHIFDKNLED